MNTTNDKQTTLPPGNESHEDEIDLRLYWHILLKNKWKIIGLTLIIGLLTMVIAFSLEPIYRSSTLLYIEDKKSNVSKIDQMYDISSFKREYYQSQLEILKSWGLAEKVVKKLDLVSHPIFDPDRNKSKSSFSLSKLLPSSWVKAETEEQTDEEKHKGIVDAVVKSITITPVRNSQLVKIGFESPDKHLAAQVPNILAEMYIETDLNAKVEMTNKAARWLIDRLDGLRIKLEHSEQKLQTYMEKQNLINVAGVKSVAAKQIEETASNLVKARQHLTETESIYQQVEKLRAVAKSTAIFESIPTVLKNPLVQNLKTAELNAKSKLSELSERYGPKHPRIIAATAELQTAQSNSAEQIWRVIESISQEYDLALANVTALEASLEKNRLEIQLLNRKEAQLTILEREVNANRQLYDTFLTRFKETDASQDIQQALQTSVGRIVDLALVPSIPYKPKKKLIIVISLVLGFLFSTMLAFFLEYLDHTIKNGEDVEHKLGLHMLGAIPKLVVNKKEPYAPRWTFINEPKSPFSESIRTIRTGVILSNLDNENCKIIGVTSSIPNEGKSTFSTSQALAISQMHHTLLIDADMRKPTLGKSLGLPSKAMGLSELVAGSSPLKDCIYKLSDDIEGDLEVMPSGSIPPNPLELLSSAKFKQILDDLKNQYEYIIIDTAPVMLVSDAIILSQYTDTLLYVVKADATPEKLIKEGVKRLHQANAPIKNIILNQVSIKKKGRYGYGYGGYGAYGAYGGYYGET